MTGYLHDWLTVLLRWVHIIAAIGWVGASFYLAWLDEPPLPPRTLIWLSRQALTTWLSGAGLLILVYLLKAPAQSVALAVAILIGSWAAYEALCRSSLARGPVKLQVSFALLAAVLAWSTGALFPGPGAFMLFGAALGSIMAANLLFVVLPAQSECADAACKVRAQQRWTHNAYLVLPVLFAMLSSHSATIYGGPHSWLVLVALSFSGICIRAWLLASHRPAGRGAISSMLLLVMGLLALLIIIIGLYPDAAAPV